jgi:hypothetical protein
MSSLSLQDDDLDWEDHHDAPRSWFERLRLSHGKASSSPGGVALSAASLESEIEDALHAALQRSHEPEDSLEPAGIFQELDRRIALISVAGRLAAAIGVAAVVALFLVVMIPASRDSAGQADGARSGLIQMMKAVLNEPPAAGEEAKPGLCELQTILGPPQSQPAISHAQSETLLQQFMQWREKPVLAKNP